MKAPLRGVMVSVDYGDLLELTLPYNREHFHELMVVTRPDDERTKACCSQHGVRWYATSAFYDDGADFNKWKALEEGLDVFGRGGWMALLDADVLWPRCAGEVLARTVKLHHLVTPRRLICDPVPAEIPPEDRWENYPLHRQEKEFAGYSQIFHADDQHLGPPPWHETNWRHAGGADSFFQAKWPEWMKVRPAFKVLHLGPAGVNWCGRVDAGLAGAAPPEGPARLAKLRHYLRDRTLRPRGPGEGRYDHEKLKGSSGI